MTRPIQPIDRPAWFSFDHCAELLITQSALGNLSYEDALVVAQYMRPLQIQAGVSFIKEGQADNTHYMVLVIDGDVTIESRMNTEDHETVLFTATKGALLGEMGVLDEGPRSASCTAFTDLQVAILTREDLLHLVKEHPSVGVALILAISKRLSDRLRDTTQKLNKFIRLYRILNDEVSNGLFRR